MPELYSNHSGTTLAAAITTTTRPVTFSVASTVGLPASGNFRIVFPNYEIMLITAVNGTQFTGTTVEGTIATTHAAGETINHVLTAESYSQGITDAVTALRTAGQTYTAPATNNTAGGGVGFNTPSSLAWQEFRIVPFNSNLFNDQLLLQVNMRASAGSSDSWNTVLSLLFGQNLLRVHNGTVAGFLDSGNTFPAYRLYTDTNNVLNFDAAASGGAVITNALRMGPAGFVTVGVGLNFPVGDSLTFTTFPVQGVGVTKTGTGGSTSYTYAVAPVAPDGSVGALSYTFLSNGNATLSGSNYNTITWASLTGAAKYNVYRTQGSGVIGRIATVASSVLSLNDTGLSGDGVSPVLSAATAGSVNTQSLFSANLYVTPGIYGGGVYLQNAAPLHFASSGNAYWNAFRALTVFGASPALDAFQFQFNKKTSPTDADFWATAFSVAAQTGALTFNGQQSYVDGGGLLTISNTGPTASSTRSWIQYGGGSTLINFYNSTSGTWGNALTVSGGTGAVAVNTNTTFSAQTNFGASYFNSAGSFVLGGVGRNVNFLGSGNWINFYMGVIGGASPSADYFSFYYNPRATVGAADAYAECFRVDTSGNFFHTAPVMSTSAASTLFKSVGSQAAVDVGYYTNATTASQRFRIFVETGAGTGGLKFGVYDLQAGKFVFGYTTNNQFSVPNEIFTNNVLHFNNAAIAADPDGAKIGAGTFVAGLNIVGANTDNTYRKIAMWGPIAQQQNDGANSFIGTTNLATVNVSGDFTSTNRAFFQDSGGANTWFSPFYSGGVSIFNWNYWNGSGWATAWQMQGNGNFIFYNAGSVLFRQGVNVVFTNPERVNLGVDWQSYSPSYSGPGLSLGGISFNHNQWVRWGPFVTVQVSLVVNISGTGTAINFSLPVNTVAGAYVVGATFLDYTPIYGCFTSATNFQMVYTPGFPGGQHTIAFNVTYRVT